MADGDFIPKHGNGTLYDRALAQDGNPIPRDHAVTVELLDSHDTVNETREFTRTDTVDQLAAFIGDFAASMVSEGMAGSVRWTAAQPSE